MKQLLLTIFAISSLSGFALVMIVMVIVTKFLFQVLKNLLLILIYIMKEMNI